MSSVQRCLTAVALDTRKEGRVALGLSAAPLPFRLRSFCLPQWWSVLVFGHGGEASLLFDGFEEAIDLLGWFFGIFEADVLDGAALRFGPLVDEITDGFPVEREAIDGQLGLLIVCHCRFL